MLLGKIYIIILQENYYISIKKIKSEVYFAFDNRAYSIFLFFGIPCDGAKLIVPKV